MKRRKTIILLLGILTAVSAVTLVIRQVEDRKEQIKNTDEVILSVNPDEVDSLAWKYDSTELSFHKTEKTWLWDGDGAFPVNADVIRSLISDFESFSASFIIENADDLSQYGLDAPICTITLSAGEQTHGILLGSYSTMDSQRYVSVGDGNVYLVSEDPFYDFEIVLDDTIQNDEIPSIENVSSIQFAGAENYTIHYAENSADTYCAEDVYFTQQDGASVPLDTDNVDAYLSAVSDLSLTDYSSYNVTDEELAEWGLDTPALTVTVNYTTNSDKTNSSQTEDDSDGDSDHTFALHVGLNQKELAEKEEAEAKNKEYDGTVTAYARIDNSKMVYQISSDDFDSLAAASYNDLRHQEVLTADFGAVTQLDITLEGSDYTITSKKEKKDDERTYSYQDEEINIESLQSSITSLTIKEFSDEQPSEKKEIGLTFHLDNEKYPQISVEIYRYNGTSCLVVLDGKPLGSINRSAVVDLIEAVNAIILG